MERMNPLDASFLYFEDGITHMHIAVCGLFEGPPPDYRQVVDAIAAKLPQVPRYRQVVRFVPLQLGRPVWVDDPHFRLEYHVRHTALPRPGGRGELQELMGRLMSQELDRHRPLWEAWMVEGLEDGHWALITKIHHAMTDGVAGTDLLAVILDLDPTPTAPGAAPAWTPVPEPSSLHLLADAAWRMAANPVEQLQSVRRVVQVPRRALTMLRETTGGMRSYAGRLRPTTPTSLVGAIGPHRRWTWASAELAQGPVRGNRQRRHSVGDHRRSAVAARRSR
jgi:WS/DGAT/MGAT family acyltransferase